jgi:hypothetical protein
MSVAKNLRPKAPRKPLQTRASVTPLHAVRSLPKRGLVARIAIPPLPLQSAFAEQAKRIETTTHALDAAAVKAETIVAALSAEVFG